MSARCILCDLQLLEELLEGTDEDVVNIDAAFARENEDNDFGDILSLHHLEGLRLGPTVKDILIGDVRAQLSGNGTRRDRANANVETVLGELHAHTFGEAGDSSLGSAIHRRSREDLAIGIAGDVQKEARVALLEVGKNGRRSEENTVEKVC